MHERHDIFSHIFFAMKSHDITVGKNDRFNLTGMTTVIATGVPGCEFALFLKLIWYRTVKFTRDETRERIETESLQRARFDHDHTNVYNEPDSVTFVRTQIWIGRETTCPSPHSPGRRHSEHYHDPARERFLCQRVGHVTLLTCCIIAQN